MLGFSLKAILKSVPTILKQGKTQIGKTSIVLKYLLESRSLYISLIIMDKKD